MTDKHIPTDHEVETFTGRYVDVGNPRADSIVLEDIAHALANTCRYGGHCKTFYSVAEHSVFCSIRVERQGYGRAYALAALHHDDAEAFLGDIPRPMKPLLGEAYEQMSDTMDAAIAEALGLPFGPEVFHADPVKEADNWALFVEAKHLLPSQGKLWWSGAQGADKYITTPLPSRIVVPDYWRDGIGPKAAETLYIARHHALTHNDNGDPFYDHA